MIIYITTPQKTLIRKSLKRMTGLEKTMRKYTSSKQPIASKLSFSVKKVQNMGMLMFPMSMPKTQIKHEEYINTTTCMRCYKMKDHYTNQCTEEKNSKYLCSECREEGHT